MRFLPLLFPILVRKLGLILLAALLAGCGTRIASPNQTPAHLPTNLVSSPTEAVPTPTETVSVPPRAADKGFLPVNPGVAFDVKGVLHIQSIDGISCRWDRSIYNRIRADSRLLMPNDLVLNTPQHTYETGVIQQVAQYVDARWDGQSQRNSIPPLPAGFNTTPGSATGANSNCDGTLDITNISPNPIQLSGVNMRLALAPQTNRYHYQLIDVCSLPLSGHVSEQVCPPPGGGGGALDYQYSFTLEGWNVDAVFSGKQSTLSPGPTLGPGQAVTIYVTFSSARSLVYSLIPEVVIDTPGEQKTIELPQLTSYMAFANPNQFSCYTLRGHSFQQVEIDPGGLKNYCL